MGRACRISEDALEKTDGVRLARQCARAGECDRAKHRAVFGRCAERRGYPAGRESRTTGLAALSNFLPDGMNLDQYEQSIIREALRRAGGNKSQAARLLGITRNALRYRLSQMGIEDAAAQAN